MRRALIIGIDDYVNAPALQGCINDAISINSILEINGDGSPNFGSRLHTSSATVPIPKAFLKTQVEQLFATECKTALFYFSGHGFIDSTGGYIASSDAQKGDEGLPMDTILSLANQSKARDRIILLDCCHSGAFGTPSTSGGSTCQIAEGVSILTASRDSEPSIEINGRGVFTTLLIDALRGGASDLRGHVTPGSIYAYVDQALGPWDQRPIFKTNVTKFTSVRTVTPPVPLDILRRIIEYFPSPEDQHALDPSYEFTCDAAKDENVTIFKHLQKFESVGLVVPVDEEHMYFAAMNSRSCKLTALGYQYWRLVKDKRV
jgi:hypothetical protein